MPLSTNADWQQIVLYAVGAALLLMLLFRLPVVGRLLRFGVTLALASYAVFLLVQQAAFQPQLARSQASSGSTGRRWWARRCGSG